MKHLFAKYKFVVFLAGVLILLLSLSACNSVGEIQLGENISVITAGLNAGTVRVAWDGKVMKNGNVVTDAYPTYTVVYTKRTTESADPSEPITINTTANNIFIEDLADGNYITIQISASLVGAASAASEEFIFKYTSPIIPGKPVLRYDDVKQIVSWDEMPIATSYTVSYRSVGSSIDEKTIINNTYVNCSDLFAYSGRYVISVFATADKYLQSEISDVLTVTYNLPVQAKELLITAPKDKDGSCYGIQWTDMQSDRYTVSITPDGGKTERIECQEPEYILYKYADGELTITVTSYKAGYEPKSATIVIESYKKHTLAVPAVTLTPDNGGMLCQWQKVTYAVSYDVTYTVSAQESTAASGTAKTVGVQNNSFLIPLEETDLGKFLTVTVTAKGKQYKDVNKDTVRALSISVKATATCAYKKLNTPQNVKFVPELFSIVWDAVEGAAGYALNLTYDNDGEVVEINASPSGSVFKKSSIPNGTVASYRLTAVANGYIGSDPATGTVTIRNPAPAFDTAASEIGFNDNYSIFSWKHIDLKGAYRTERPYTAAMQKKASDSEEYVDVCSNIDVSPVNGLCSLQMSDYDCTFKNGDSYRVTLSLHRNEAEDYSSYVDGHVELTGTVSYPYLPGVVASLSTDNGTITLDKSKINALGLNITFVVTAKDSADTEITLTQSGEAYSVDLTGYNNGEVITVSVKAETSENPDDGYRAYTASTELTIIKDGQSVSVGDWEYLLNGGTLSLLKYNGTASDVTAPASFNGNAVTAIKTACFSGNVDITRITFAEGITTIENNAFVGCAKLTDIVLPSTVSNANGAFDGCTSINDVAIDENNATYTVESNCLISKISGVLFRSFNATEIPVTVVSIGSGAFTGYTSLVSVTIPENTVEIAGGAFKGCTALAAINLNSLSLTIREKAFEGCIGLVDIIIPQTVTTIEANAFVGCSNLTIRCNAFNKPEGWNADWNANGESTVPTVWANGTYSYSVTENEISITHYEGSETAVTVPAVIGGMKVTAFGDENGSFVSLSLPATIKTLNKTHSDRLTTVSFATGSELKTLSADAFFSCPILTTPILPVGITTIKTHAFNDCPRLKSLRLPVGITTIETDAFYNCDALTIGCTEYNAPDGWSESFFGTSAVTWAINDYRYAIIGAAASVISYIGSDTEVVIPSKLANYPTKTIAQRAFADRTDVTSITIPDSISSIGTDAFVGCINITNATIPTTAIAYIPKNALQTVIINGGSDISADDFSGCTELTSVTFADSVTSIEAGAFEGCSELATVTFNDTETWYGTTNSADWENKVNGVELDVSSPTDNVALFADGSQCLYKL